MAGWVHTWRFWAPGSSLLPTEGGDGGVWYVAQWVQPFLIWCRNSFFKCNNISWSRISNIYLFRKKYIDKNVHKKSAMILYFINQMCVCVWKIVTGWVSDESIVIDEISISITFSGWAKDGQALCRLCHSWWSCRGRPWGSCQCTYLGQHAGRRQFISEWMPVLWVLWWRALLGLSCEEIVKHKLILKQLNPFAGRMCEGCTFGARGL